MTGCLIGCVSCLRRCCTTAALEPRQWKRAHVLTWWLRESLIPFCSHTVWRPNIHTTSLTSTTLSRGDRPGLVVGLVNLPAPALVAEQVRGSRGHYGWSKGAQHQQHLPELYEIFKDTCGWFYTYFRDKTNIWGIGSIQRRWASTCCCSTGFQGTLQV